MRIRLAVFCLLVACGPGADKNGDGIADGVQSPSQVSTIAPSTPIGTLSGQTLNTDFTPLDQVDVTAIVGGAMPAGNGMFKVTSKSDGSFALTGLPAGAQVQVTLSKATYATAHVSATVPGAAGQFPIDNGNANVGVIAMTQLSDNLTFQVVTASGEPAKGAKAMIEVTPAAMRVSDFSTYGNGVGVVVINADMPAGDDGVITFKNVPGLKEETRLGGQYTVTVGAVTVDGADFLGNRIIYTAQSLYLGSASHVIALPSAHATTPVSIIASNVDSAITGVASAPLKNMVKPSAPLFFVFDQPVLENTIEIKMTDESGTQRVMESHSLNAMSRNILQVQPGMTEQGKEYNVAMRLVSADNGSVLTRTFYFFAGDPAMPMQFAVQKIGYIKAPGHMQSQPEVGDTMVVTFNQPVRNVGGAAVDAVFAFDINNNSVRTDPGEDGDTKDPSPFVLIPNEPVAEPMTTFVNLASGYTTRYQFVYGMPATVTLPISTMVTLRFSRVVATLGEYRTIWDQPVEMDMASAVQ